MNKAEELKGWICPRCGIVHSPFSTECNCFPYEIKYTTTDGTGFNHQNQQQ